MGLMNYADLSLRFRRGDDPFLVNRLKVRIFTSMSTLANQSRVAFLTIAIGIYFFAFVFDIIDKIISRPH